jgi:hypothetical protein
MASDSCVSRKTPESVFHFFSGCIFGGGVAGLADGRSKGVGNCQEIDFDQGLL